MHDLYNYYQDLLDSFYQRVYRKDLGYFISFSEHMLPRDYAGWKFTILGQSADDAVHLMETLGQFLINIEAPFKVGTQRLYNEDDGEQQYKALTIYITKQMNAELLEQDIKHFLKDYTGGEGVSLKWSEKINEYLYKRHDLDENGYYIYANPEDNNDPNKKIYIGEED